MGLFSSDKTYTTYAASAGLFDESPGTFKNNLVQSTISGSSKSGAVLNTIMTDQHARVKKMMKYALKEDGYIRGVPTSNMSLITIEPAAVEAALNRAVGGYEDIRVTYKGKWNERFFLAKQLQDLFSGQDYFPWGSAHWDEYSETIQIPVTNPDTGDYYTTANTFEYVRRNSLNPLNIDIREEIGPDRYARVQANINENYLVSFPYVDSSGADQVWDIPQVINIGDVFTFNWVMVAYSIGTEVFYWTYKIGSDVDPIFETSIDVSEKDGSFLPVAVLMQDKVWFDENADGSPAEETELTLTTNKLLKKLATSGTEIKEEFVAQELEDNESGDSQKSNAKKWDFFVHYAIPIESRIRGSREYLWYFFNEMMDWSTETSRNYYDYLAHSISSQPLNELNITEAGENGYNVSYRWSFIEKKYFEGDYVIEDPRADENERPLKPKEVTSELVQRTKVISDEYQAVVDEFFGSGTPVGGWADPDKTGKDGRAALEAAGFHDFFVITKATEDGLGYERMLVMGLSMQYKINTRTEPGDKVGYRYRYATPKLFGLNEETEEFRIPILWKSLQDVPVLHREEAVADGLTATVFLVEVTKVAWYQTGFFKWLLIVIAIVLLVLSIWFQPLIELAILTFGAALGGGAMAMFIAYVVLQFAIGYMIALGTSMMSPGMQMVLAVVIFIAMLYTGQYQNIKDSFSAFKSAPGWMTAATMINMVGPIYNMGFSVYSQYTMGKYEEEFRDLILSQRERQQILEDAWDSFGPVPSWLDPLELQHSFDRAGAGEKPDGYFARVLIPNPGVLGYDLVNNFASNNLVLPESAGPTMIDSMMMDFEEQRG